MDRPQNTEREGRRRQRRDAGNALLEMAIVLPVLMLLTMGIVDFGRVFYAGMAIDQAARAGVQYGAQGKDLAADCAGIKQAAVDAAQDVDWKCVIDDVEKTGVDCVTATRSCKCTDNSNSTNCVPADCGSGTEPKVFVQVVANYTFKTFAPYPGIPNSVNLNRSAVMRVK